MLFFRAEFDESCERLSDEFQDLERHVNAAVLQQIVDVFKETTEPLERMMKAALAPSLVSSLGFKMNRTFKVQIF